MPEKIISEKISLAAPKDDKSSIKIEPPSGQNIIINIPSAGSEKEPEWPKTLNNAVASSAWPIALVLIALIFKNPISSMIDRVKNFKGGGVEFSAEELIEKELPNRETVEKTEKFIEYMSPIDSIVTAWVNVEKATRDAAMRAIPAMVDGRRTMPYSTILRNIEALEREGLTPTANLRTVLADMAKVRNQAVHKPDEPISREAVLKFVANADWAIAELGKIQPRTPAT